MTRFAPLSLLALLSGLGFGAGLGLGPAAAFELGTGVDVISDPQTRIEALHRLYIGHEIGPGLSFGQSVYSAAKGDAGGAFFWGVEAVKMMPVSGPLSATAGLFLGGGGGAAQVVGDGFMTRAHVGLRYAASERLGYELGASWVKITGADIEDPAVSLGLSYNFGVVHPSEEAGAPGFGALKRRGVSLRAGAGAARGANRTGAAQADLGLFGAEGAFSIGPGREVFLAADGAAKGGEGYMQILAGGRQRWATGPVGLFVEGGLGFGGGGEVDTGAGGLLSLGAGVAVPVAPWADVEFALGGVASAGEYKGAQASVRLVRVFARDPGATAPGGGQKWAYTLGVAMQDPNPGFRKPGVTATARPILQESSVDMFLTERSYISGTAQTALGGDVAGYAIGLLGLGYEMPLGGRWYGSLEAQLGAAGGGGVNANGGLIGGARVELDYALNESARLSFALGKLTHLKSGTGMAPTTAQIGVKFPFTTR